MGCADGSVAPLRGALRASVLNGCRRRLRAFGVLGRRLIVLLSFYLISATETPGLKDGGTSSVSSACVGNHPASPRTSGAARTPRLSLSPQLEHSRKVDFKLTTTIP